MSNLNKLFGILRCSNLLLPKSLQIPGTGRNCSDQSKLPKKIDYSDVTRRNEDIRVSIYKEPGVLESAKTVYWNEAKSVKRLRKQNTFPRNINHTIDLLNGLVAIRVNFPSKFSGLEFWFNKLREKRNLIEQKFLPIRHGTLKPDLAAAHFLFRRGGAVKFVGQPYWVGIKEEKKNLPNTFVPGFYVEEIKLEGTDLFYEGLQNLINLKYLRSLSLKNLEHVNDWWLDWISSEYYHNLKHLDLTNCKNVTSRGLSCFYRFENLETLNVEGVSDSPEFKLACVMLQDIMPKLDIKGIDLTVPEEIKAVEVKQDKMSPEVNAV